MMMMTTTARIPARLIYSNNPAQFGTKNAELRQQTALAMIFLAVLYLYGAITPLWELLMMMTKVLNLVLLISSNVRELPGSRKKN